MGFCVSVTKQFFRWNWATIPDENLGCLWKRHFGRQHHALASQKAPLLTSWGEEVAGNFSGVANARLRGVKYLPHTETYLGFPLWWGLVYTTLGHLLCNRRDFLPTWFIVFFSFFLALDVLKAVPGSSRKHATTVAPMSGEGCPNSSTKVCGCQWTGNNENARKQGASARVTFGRRL